jgi:hypothetical protein
MVDAVCARAVDRVERQISDRPVQGVLPDATVEALDVVYHALVLADEPRALEAWRRALWDRQLVPEARGAVEAMFEYLADAQARGEDHLVSDICDCLHAFLGPEAHAHEGSSGG